MAEDPIVLFVPPLKEVIVREEERPVLYDAQSRPLRRPVGFQCR